MAREISDEAVLKATGHDWAEWFELLDAAGADGMTHREIAAWLVDEGPLEGDDGWWAQAVTVAWERETGRRVRGETKDSGFQVAVQRTLSIPADEAWTLLTEGPGRGVWLGGDPGDLAFEPGATARTDAGHEIEIRTTTPGERIRLRWRPPGRDEPTTLEVQLVDRGDRTAIRFDQERLADAAERERMKRHWTDVLTGLQALVT
ncbi:MAG: SRPBCC domain-containing protein [Gemmatimonadales bacterium]|jgi:uncharacterized protein YndB with AHSA1/START domain